MVDIFQEVDEDLRREKLEKFWKKFGPYIIGAVVLFIGGMAGKVFYDQYEKSQRMAESEIYQEAVAALDAGNTEEAMAGFEQLAGSAKFGYELLAQLQRASELTARGEVDEGLAIYEGIAADSSYAEVYRDYAALNAAMIALDRGDLADAEARLQPLAAEGGSWSFSAREMLGLIYLETEAWDEAEEIFSALSNNQRTPPDMQARAGEFLEIVLSAKPAPAPLTIGDEEPLAEQDESMADEEGR